MKITPIAYVDDMTRALLDGRKLMTRRICTAYDVNGKGFDTYSKDAMDALVRHGPYGQPGDLLWVRESAEFIQTTEDQNGKTFAIQARYSADGQISLIEYPERLAPHPKVGKFMANGCYREASRLTLRITDVRVERLQDISEADAEAEGACRYDVSEFTDDEIALLDAPVLDRATPYVNGFSMVWDGINSKRGLGWRYNPWVWVIAFEIIRQNVDALIAGANYYAGRSI